MKPLCTKPPRFTAMFTWPMKISGHKTRQQNQDATRWRGKAQKRSGPCRRMVMSPILCMSRTQKSCKLRNKTATSCTEDSAPWQILHFLLRHPLWENSWLSLAMRTIWILVITGSSCSQGYPSTLQIYRLDSNELMDCSLHVLRSSHCYCFSHITCLMAYGYPQSSLLPLGSTLPHANPWK